jgi:peroxiredoxin
MKRSIVAGAVLCVVAAAVVGLTYAAPEDAVGLKGKAANDFTLTTLDGKSAKLSEQKGKVVLVDTWATWCPPCRASLPHVQKLATDKSLAEKGLIVWAVNDKETKDDVQKFLTENKYTFSVPMDTDGKVLKDYQVTGIPTTFIIGKDGVIKDVFVGYGGDESAKAIDAAVEKALAEK